MPLHKKRPQPLPPARYPPHKWWDALPPDSPSPVDFSGRGVTPFSTTTVFSKSGSSTAHSSKLRTLLSSLGHFRFSLRRCRCGFHSSRDAQYDDATISSVSTGTQCPSDDEAGRKSRENDRGFLHHRSKTHPFAEDHSDTYDDIKHWLAHRKRQRAGPTFATRFNTSNNNNNNNATKKDSQAGGGRERQRHYQIEWRDDPEPAAFSPSSSASASASVYARAYPRRPARSREMRTRMLPGVGTLVPTESEHSRAMAAMMSRNVKVVLKRLEVDRTKVVSGIAAAGSYSQGGEAEEEETLDIMASFARSGEEAEDPPPISSSSSATSYGSVYTVSSIAFSGFPSLITIENQHQHKEGKETSTRSAVPSPNDDDAREPPSEVVSRTGTPPSPFVPVLALPLLDLPNISIPHLDHQTIFPPSRPDDIHLDQTAKPSTTITSKPTAKTIRVLLHFTLELPHNGGFVRSNPTHAQPLILDVSTDENQCRAVRQLRAHLRKIGTSTLFSVKETPFINHRNDNSASSNGAAAAAAAAADQNQAEKTASNDGNIHITNSNSTSQNLAINFPQLFSPQHPFRHVVEKVWGPSLHWAWADANEAGFSEALVVLLGKIGEEQIKKQMQMQTMMMTHGVSGGDGRGRGHYRSSLKGSMDSALSGLWSSVDGESDEKGEERWSMATLDVLCVVRRLDGSGGDGHGYGLPMDVRTTASGLLNGNGRESDQSDVSIN